MPLTCVSSTSNVAVCGRFRWRTRAIVSPCACTGRHCITDEHFSDTARFINKDLIYIFFLNICRWSLEVMRMCITLTRVSSSVGTGKDGKEFWKEYNWGRVNLIRPLTRKAHERVLRLTLRPAPLASYIQPVDDNCVRQLYIMTFTLLIHYTLIVQ